MTAVGEPGQCTRPDHDPAGFLLPERAWAPVGGYSINDRAGRGHVDLAYSKDAFSVVVSGADHKIFGFLNGQLLFESSIEISGGKPVGEHVFVLRGAHDERDRLEWVAIGMGARPEDNIDQHSELAKAASVIIPQSIRTRISQNLHPGSTFVFTELSAHPSTRSESDFVVMRVAPGN